MIRSENLERLIGRGMMAIFACSVLLCLSYLVRIYYSYRHFHKSFPYEDAFRIGDEALIIAMGIVLLWRQATMMRRIRQVPALREVLRDERVTFVRLRAYRPAVWALFSIQALSKVPLIIWPRPWDMPYLSALTLSAGIAVGVGAFLWYSRGKSHE